MILRAVKHDLNIRKDKRLMVYNINLVIQFEKGEIPDSVKVGKNDVGKLRIIFFYDKEDLEEVKKLALENVPDPKATADVFVRTFEYLKIPEKYWKDRDIIKIFSEFWIGETGEKGNIPIFNFGIPAFNLSIERIADMVKKGDRKAYESLAILVKYLFLPDLIGMPMVEENEKNITAVLDKAIAYLTEQNRRS
jgi:hypothetical protein